MSLGGDPGSGDSDSNGDGGGIDDDPLASFSLSALGALGALGGGGGRGGGGSAGARAERSILNDFLGQFIQSGNATTVREFPESFFIFSCGVGWPQGMHSFPRLCAYRRCFSFVLKRGAPTPPSDSLRNVFCGFCLFMRGTNGSCAGSSGDWLLVGAIVKIAPTSHFRPSSLNVPFPSQSGTYQLHLTCVLWV